MKLLLKKYFGYDDFRPMQLDIINSIIAKNDTLVLMPTGGGKSLCYQIPALKLNGLTIVISPLISLMKDQVDALQINGIPAEYINSTLTKEEIEDIKLRIVKQEVKLLYIAPERLALKNFKTFLSNIKISLIAIDEAHCISEWGHDFRREYGNLKFLKKTFPKIPIIALTATATKKVQNDILKQLKLNNPKIYNTSFNRDNLNLIVREKKNSFAQILCLLEKHEGESIIIYCHSRKDTITLVNSLKQYGFKAIAYHAGLTPRIREINQEKFVKDKVNIIVATIAFGMGIDKPNVRLVIHNTFSKSIESYYQEIGRAGRDGLMSECILFYSPEDTRKHEFFIEMKSNNTLKKVDSAKLNDMVKYCETNKCRRKYLLEYFGEEISENNCQKCDICLQLPKNNNTINTKVLNRKNKSYDNELYKELKILREKIATQKKIPPTTIFGDIALREMATNFPETEADFIKINGVSSEKLNNFSEDFLMLINEYSMINNIANNIKPKTIKESPPKIYAKKYTKKKYYKTKKKWKKKKYTKFDYK